MHFVKPVDRNQSVIFGSLDNLIACDHPVRIIDAIISNIVQSNPEKFEYKGKQNIGRRAYSPEMMLKLFVYGYLNGISSSRKLEVETHRNIELKWLLGDLQPDHKTIANYRKENSKHIEFVTVEFRGFLKSYGYIKGKKVAIDGTKVKANANRDMLTVKKIEKRMSKLDGQLEKYLNKLATSDAQADVLDETEGLDIDSKNKELVREVASLRLKIEQLDQTKAVIVESEKKYLSPSDPDASLMRSREGLIPAYNIQSVVDSENHMIAEALVSTSVNDKNELLPVVKSLKKKIKIEPQELLADKGYYNRGAIRIVENECKTTCFIPGEKVKDEVEFTYDKTKDIYVCQLGKTLKFKQNKKKNGVLVRMYQGQNCSECPIRSKCTKAKLGRILYRREDQEWCDGYKVRIESEDGKKKIGERKNIVEHAFGTIKYWMGQIPLLMRGRLNVQTEVDIYTTAYNLKRLMNIESFGNLMKKITEYEWNIEAKGSDGRATAALNTICTFSRRVMLGFYAKTFFRENTCMLKIGY